jgi:hypothetical protein
MPSRPAEAGHYRSPVRLKPDTAENAYSGSAKLNTVFPAASVTYCLPLIA